MQVTDLDMFRRSGISSILEHMASLVTKILFIAFYFADFYYTVA